MGNETKAYIELLRYGLKNQGITYQEALEYLKSHKISFTEHELTYFNTLLQRHFHLAFESFSGTPFSIDSHSERYYLKLEAMSFLVSYESIESAKEDAKRAERLAQWSIGLTILATIASIYISIKFR